MTTRTLAQRVVYERLSSGLDVYVLRTETPDVVVANIVLPLGALYSADRRTVSLLIGELLPGGSRAHTKSALLEALDGLGADVHTTVDLLSLTVTVRCTHKYLDQVLELVFAAITLPHWQRAEWLAAHARIANLLHEASEDTKARALSALMRSLYKKGHPWFRRDEQVLAREIEGTTLNEVRSHYTDTLSTVGASVIVAGDVREAEVVGLITRISGGIPTRPGLRDVVAQLGRTTRPKSMEVVVPMRDKMNVDTFLVVPLSITNGSDAYLPLVLGTHILGGSATARLFRVLRNERSLTYGAYARLHGFETPYPGYFCAKAVFPNDVYSAGRVALREQVALFKDKGVTAGEVALAKENIAGRFKVGLSSTSGVATALLGVVTSGRSVAYLDEYPQRIAQISHKEINGVVREHFDPTLGVVGAAGAIGEDGAPL